VQLLDGALGDAAVVVIDERKSAGPTRSRSVGMTTCMGSLTVPKRCLISLGRAVREIADE
jgi:hypothetical protein